MEGSGKDHLSTTNHAAPPTVRGETGTGNGSETSTICHPRNGMVVVNECMNVRGSPFNISGTTITCRMTWRVLSIKTFEHYVTGTHIC